MTLIPWSKRILIQGKSQSWSLKLTLSGYQPVSAHLERKYRDAHLYQNMSPSPASSYDCNLKLNLWIVFSHFAVLSKLTFLIRRKKIRSIQSFTVCITSGKHQLWPGSLMREYELLHPVDFAMAVAICLYTTRIILSIYNAFLISSVIKEQVLR